MKFKVFCKSKTIDGVKKFRKKIYYFDFDFLNYKGERLLFCCTAPTFDLALLNFKRYTEYAPVTLLNVAVSDPSEAWLQ